MATYRINTPDGATYDVTAPDDAKQEDILAYAQAHHNSGQLDGLSAEHGINTEPKSGIDNASLKTAFEQEPLWKQKLLAATSGLVKTALGAKQLVSDLTPEQQDIVSAANVAESEAPFTAAGGNIATMLTPGLNAAKFAAKAPMAANIASGAGYMALQPNKGAESNISDRAIEALKGGAAGAAGGLVSKGMGRVLNPQTNAEVLALQKEGVTPTIGQILGGPAKKAEEAARSVPILGDAITRAHKQAMEQFNRAAINRALTPIGKEIDKDAPVGYKAVDSAYSTVSDAYDSLLPKLHISADPQFQAEIGSLKSLAQNLNPQQAQQFDAILNNEVMGKFTQHGLMSGETMKQVESKLGQLSRGYSRSENYDQQLLGDALQEAQASLRKMVERNNPKYAGELGKINNAYANLLRIENAAARQGAKEGIFTPSQLEAATRAMDSSLRKRASSHGKALMQDLATAGDAVLSQRLPNSGTVDRALYGLGGLASGVVNPAIPAALIGGAGIYTKPAQNALAAALTKRPDVVRQLGAGVSDFSPYAALISAGAIPAIEGQR